MERNILEEAIKKLKKEYNARPIAGILLWKDRKGNSGTIVAVEDTQQRLMLIEAAEVEKLYIINRRKQKAQEYFETENMESHPVYGKNTKDVGIG